MDQIKYYLEQSDKFHEIETTKLREVIECLKIKNEEMTDQIKYLDSLLHDIASDISRTVDLTIKWDDKSAISTILSAKTMNELGKFVISKWVEE